MLKESLSCSDEGRAGGVQETLYYESDAINAIGGGELDDSKPRRVSDMLRDGFDGFSRSQKAVARYIIYHLEEVGYLSAE